MPNAAIAIRANPASRTSRSRGASGSAVGIPRNSLRRRRPYGRPRQRVRPQPWRPRRRRPAGPGSWRPGARCVGHADAIRDLVRGQRCARLADIGRRRRGRRPAGQATDEVHPNRPVHDVTRPVEQARPRGSLPGLAGGRRVAHRDRPGSEPDEHGRRRGSSDRDDEVRRHGYPGRTRPAFAFRTRMLTLVRGPAHRVR